MSKPTRIALSRGGVIRVESELGAFTIGPIAADYSGRDTIEVELEPADGCARKHSTRITREHVYEPMPLPKRGELRNYFSAVKRFLLSEQEGRAYPSHFGVSPPDLGRFRVETRPTFVSIAVRDPLHRVGSGGIINPITGEELGELKHVVASVFKVLDSWGGTEFVSFRFEDVSPESHREAYKRSGTAAGKAMQTVGVPAGWRA